MVNLKSGTARSRAVGCKQRKQNLEIAIFCKGDLKYEPRSSF
jgi:hypothetical protein